MSRGASSQSIDVILLPAPDLSSKPVSHLCCCRLMGQMDGRTLDRFTTLTGYYAAVVKV